MSVGEVAHFIFELEPQKNPARLAFYSYLNSFLPPDKTFTQEMLDVFYDRALTLAHWQTNKQHLGETIRDDLLKVNELGKEKQTGLAFDPDQALHCCDFQVVPLETPRDFQALLEKAVEKFEGFGEKVRLFALRDGFTHTRQEVLVVRLQKSGSLIVDIQPNITIIVDGELQLVRPHSRLTYSHSLDLEPGVEQILATSVLRVARFQKSGTNVAGAYIQGINFAQSSPFEKPISEIPELLRAVKRIERYYINPASDPYYQDLYETLKTDSP